MTSKFSFSPNQLAANVWYKPGTPPALINGHLDESFGVASRWPTLRRHLAQTGGAFGIMAAELAHLHPRTGLLALLKAEGIPTAVEVPAFTQPQDGATLARLELTGAGMAAIFQTEPGRKGWFVTRDGAPFRPDELIFDERLPNLLPTFDPVRLATTKGSWDERKQAARQQPKANRQALMQDYVAYLTVAKAHWGTLPAVSLHWNVNPGWEWRDEDGLDTIHASDPTYFDTPERFWQVVGRKPQYNSVRYLDQLLAVLKAAGFTPKTVYMDVDWTYDIPYITEVLRRHQRSLARQGVQLGINVVEASLTDQEALRYKDKTLRRVTDPGTAPNLLYAQTLIAITAFLQAQGLATPAVQLRIGSWSHRPYEVREQVEESRPGSLAHTACRIIEARRS